MGKENYITAKFNDINRPKLFNPITTLSDFDNIKKTNINKIEHTW